MLSFVRRPPSANRVPVQMTTCSAANVLQTLLTKIDEDQIPREYGGSSEYALGEHPWEVSKNRGKIRGSFPGQDGVGGSSSGIFEVAALLSDGSM